MIYPSKFKSTGNMHNFMDSVPNIVASMKANALIYVTATLLLVMSFTFFVLGSSSRTLNFADRINGLSYSLGLQIGRNLGTHNININMTMFLRGLGDGRYGHPSILTHRQLSEANEVVMIIMQCQATTANIRTKAYEDFIVNNFTLVNEIDRQGILRY